MPPWRHERVSGEDAPADHGYVAGFGWFRVSRRGDTPVAPPAGLSPAARRRRRFAERLAEEMAFPGTHLRVLGHDFEAASSVFVPVVASPLAQRVLAEAEAVTEAVTGTPGQTRLYSNTLAAVVLVHGPGWSLVFDVGYFGPIVRVCGDELGETALAVDEDPDPAVQARLWSMIEDVLWQLRRVAVGGDRYSPSPAAG